MNKCFKAVAITMGAGMLTVAGIVARGVNICSKYFKEAKEDYFEMYPIEDEEETIEKNVIDVDKINEDRD